MVRKLLLLMAIGLLIGACYPHEQFELDKSFDLQYMQIKKTAGLAFGFGLKAFSGTSAAPLNPTASPREMPR